MSIPNKIKDFNDTVESLLQQIAPFVGTSYHHYFLKLIRINAVLPIQHFIHYAMPMKDKILNRDETYITNTDNHSDKVKNHDSALTEILRLTNIYGGLSQESKDTVWDMLMVLVITTMEYMQLKGM
jgi:hypothetical protein